MPVTPDPPELARGLTLPRARRPIREPIRPPVRSVPATLAPLIRSMTPQLRQQIVARIHQEVPPLARAGMRMQRPVREAVAIALAEFIEIAAGAGGARLDEHFRGLGRSQALVGGSTRPVQSALQAAAEVAWEALDHTARRERWSGPTVAELGRSLADYFHHLGREVERGFAAARKEAASSRGRLVKAVMGEDRESAIGELAAEVDWQAADPVVVVVAELHSTALRADLPTPDSVFIGWDRDVAVALTDESHVDLASDVLLSAGRLVKVAVSWPVSLSEARHGYEWARRALRLARDGRLRPAGRVIECRAYRTLLWREADGPLLATLSNDLLAPLLAKKPHRRVELAQTLERWLEFNESAPALAEALGVHPNTVRNRLRDLRALYGDRLDDLDDRLALRACLRSMLPQWREEQSTRRRRRRRSKGGGPGREGQAGP